LLLAAAALAAGFPASQDLRAPRAPGSAGPAEVHGSVRTAAGAPVAGARVELVARCDAQHPRGAAAGLPGLERVLDRGASGADGGFRLGVGGRAALAPLELRVEAEGFAALRRAAWVGVETRVELGVPGRASGRVEDAAGEPVAGARVEAWPGGTSSAGSVSVAPPAVATDGEGRYRLAGLAAGPWRIAVRAEGFVEWSRFVRVDAGAERRADAVLERGTAVRGRVTDGRSGEPLAGARVGFPPDGLAVVADADGRYAAAGLPLTGAAGGLSASIAARGYGAFQFPLAGLTPEGREQDFFLLPGRRARGRVVDAAGEPVEGAQVVAGASYVDGAGIVQSDWIAAVTDPAGRFELADLRAEARHTLVVVSERHATAVLDFPVEELALGALDFGDVELERPGRLAGRVVDDAGRGVGGAIVRLAGEPSRRDDLGPARESDAGYLRGAGLGAGLVLAIADPDGRFAFERFPGGRYELEARVGAGRWERAEARLESGGSVEDLELRVERGRPVAGRVVDVDGHPVWARVSLAAPVERGYGAALTAYTDAAGRFEALGFPPGACEARAEPLDEGDDANACARRHARSGPVTLAAGTLDVELVVPHAASITGTVVGPSGEPRAGVQVLLYPSGEFLTDQGAFADAAGRFTLWLAEGARADLSTWDFVGGRRVGVTLHDVAAGTADLVLRLPE